MREANWGSATAHRDLAKAYGNSLRGLATTLAAWPHLPWLGNSSLQPLGGASCLSEALGSLLEALGILGEALGGLWEAFGRLVAREVCSLNV